MNEITYTSVCEEIYQEYLEEYMEGLSCDCEFAAHEYAHELLQEWQFENPKGAFIAEDWS